VEGIFMKRYVVVGIMIALLIVGLAALGSWLMGRNVYYVADGAELEQETCAGDVRFAVIGDFGSPGSALADVAALVASWEPEFVLTAGDNNYPNGEAKTIDQNIGQYYSAFIYPYGGQYGEGAEENRFWPVPGNHDWRATELQPYLDYFTLPGNERYYDFVRDPVHFFMIDSDAHEPDGISAESVQANWLQDQLAASTSPWNVVVLHHPPYSSGRHGDNATLQWPFAEWGADMVIGGHEHSYERLERDGIVYLVNGLGGRRIYAFRSQAEGSVVRYNRDYGAMLVHAGDACLNLMFVNRQEQIIDNKTIWNN
jgi:hypothetical protein